MDIRSLNRRLRKIDTFVPIVLMVGGGAVLYDFVGVWGVVGMIITWCTLTLLGALVTVKLKEVRRESQERRERLYQELLRQQAEYLRRVQEYHESVETFHRRVQARVQVRVGYIDPKTLEALGTLGLPMTATFPEVVAAYKQKARTVHPDFGGSTEAFVKINQAYEYLRARMEAK